MNKGYNQTHVEMYTTIKHKNNKRGSRNVFEYLNDQFIHFLRYLKLLLS
jgi:hypothetical protein